MGMWMGMWMRMHWVPDAGLCNLTKTDLVPIDIDTGRKSGGRGVEEA